MAELLVFSQSFEALLRALGGKLTDASKVKFRAVGLNFDERLLPAYPLDVWVAAMELGSHILTPEATVAERHKYVFQRA